MITKEEAIKLFESKWWENKTKEEIAQFQLSEPRLCCPFEVFHEAVEAYLGRPVWTHEFANPQSLLDEKAGKIAPASLEDIIGKLEKYKKPLILVVAPEASGKEM